LEWIRRNKYNWFRAVHYLFVVFYIFGLLHSTEMLIYTIIALGMYTLDLTFRMMWGSLPSKTLLVKYKGGDIVQVKFKKHMLARMLRLNKVGQYMFVNFPSISLLEWHPFSVSSGPDEKTMEVHIKALGDHTAKLAEVAKSSESLWIRTDGPYGNHKMNFRRFPVVILAAGGIGITPVMGMMKDVFGYGDLDPVLTSKRKRAVIERVYFLWVIQSMEQFHWFEEEIKWCHDVAKKDKGVPRLSVQIFLTKGKPDEKLDEEVFQTGRPNVDLFFSKIVKDHPESASSVFTCGPRKFVNSCWDAVNEQRRSGASIRFRHETFEF